ncbi:phage protein [Gluconobacter thailandicus F149-1 = NBRC 100600]|jgi:hypothetical protein|uniref:Uncharacterized protein n=2 Tax=Gluconobacter thailandicus TaxID=257438 RepID=A0AAJ0QP02_GLUTH|nr:hypothetical protein [Gluconobacter thailandicus]AFW00509.1 hypothetical protein B932_0914 [Gluconobacter oxydans H24]ANQ40763.1 hypothetical protein BAR24_04410 [Gluconobacter oxydans]OAG74035.1 hypothetical protein A0J51_00914 [Gluconobacter japonicus]GAN91371.1 phage protein [Gluconobacter frateurii M-2]KXV33707.1 hypothetical protein AD940_09675 [Gluconobacter thailandicus]
MANPYSIGRDCRITVLWNGQRVDLRDVTSFGASQETHALRASPLNGMPVEFNVPNGWRGSFQIARASAALDNLVAAIEAAYWNAGTVGSGTIYQYVTEPDGTTSTWEYTNISIKLKNDAWQSDQMVHQTVQFFASTRTKIS